MVVLVKVIFRADDLVDLLYFRETLSSRLRRRYSGPSAGCAGHTIEHRAFIRQICPVLSLDYYLDKIRRSFVLTI